MGILMPALQRVRALRRSTACKANVRSWGVICRMYADEHDGKFSPGNRVGSPRGIGSYHCVSIGQIRIRFFCVPVRPNGLWSVPGKIYHPDTRITSRRVGFGRLILAGSCYCVLVSCILALGNEALGYIDSRGGIRRITVSADPIGIILCHRGAAYHNFCRNAGVLESLERFLHTGHGCSQ